MGQEIEEFGQWAVLRDMDRDATSFQRYLDRAADVDEERNATSGSAFWQMQALFGKLRAAAHTVKEAPPPPPAKPPRRRRRRRRGGAKVSAPVVDDSGRPAWLGPERPPKSVAVTHCAWAAPSSTHSPGIAVDEQSAREILGLAPDAGPEEVKRRFRELAKTYHPDHGGSHEDFLHISRAYADALRQLLR